MYLASGRSQGLQIPSSVVVAAAVGGSLVAGTAMARDVQLGLAATVALCYGPLVFLNLRLAIVLWLPTVSLIAVAALDVGPNLAAILILFAWFGTLAGRDSSVPGVVVQHAGLFFAAAALVLWVLLSMSWARESPLGSDTFFAWLASGAILLVISTTLTDSRYLRLAAGAFVVGAVISVAIGILGGAVQGAGSASQEATGRVVGGSGDPNFLAAGLVPAIMLATGLAAGSRRLGMGLAAILTVAGLTIGLAATGSRGGFVAAIVAAVAALVLAKQRRAWILALLLCTVGAAVAWFSVDPASWQRLSDFEDSSGRGELWNVAWRMWQDHPVTGVGLGAFRDNAAGYARELGPLKYSEFLTEQPKLAHNTYLELLAETGVVGLALYLGVVATCLRCAWLAARRFEAAGRLEMATLARTVMIAVIAMLTASTFLSSATDRRSWVLFALGPALLATARREIPARERVSHRGWRLPATGATSGLPDDRSAPLAGPTVLWTPD